MLIYFLRTSPEAKPVNLNVIGLEGWPTRLRIGVEEAFADFRAEQIQIVLHDENGQFGDTNGAYYVSGGEEISVTDESDTSTPLWAGTVDPDGITRDTIAQTITLRILQHGSLLNTIFAGMPDWNGDSSNPTMADPQQMYRVKGKADNWKPVMNSDATFNHNEIDRENADVFMTPSAFDLITDPIYRAKFAKSWLYHSATRMPFEIEHFPNRLENGNAVWTGPFRPHYRPDFNLLSSEWDNQQSALIHEGGEFVRNPAPEGGYKTLPVKDILANIIDQFNRTAKFPIAFDPDNDCIINPPQLDQVVELIARSADIESIDLYQPPWVSPANSILVLINHTSDLPPEHLVRRVSLYRIAEDLEVIPYLENTTIRLQNFGAFAGSGEPAFTGTSPGGFRFARTSFRPLAPANIQCYAARYAQIGGMQDPLHGGTRRVRINATRISIPPLLTSATISDFYYEAEYFTGVPLSQQGQRAIAFSASGTPAGIADGPELGILETLTAQGAMYRAQNGGLTVTGFTIGRVAFDYENTKLATIISDLAKLTNSRWFITPARRLKFFARLTPLSTVTLPESAIERPFIYNTKQLEDPKIALPSSGLKIAEGLSRALENYYTELALSGTAKSIRILLDKQQTGVPNINQLVILPEQDRFTEDTLIIQETTLVEDDKVELLCQTPFSSP